MISLANFLAEKRSQQIYPIAQIFHVLGAKKAVLALAFCKRQWSFSGSDGMVLFFSARTIGINAFLKVLLSLDYHH